MDMKFCVKCEDDKPLSEFPKKKQRKDGYDTRCKECVNRLNRERAAKRNAEASTQNWPTHKTCNKCGESKLLDEFAKTGEGKYGRKGQCKKCHYEWEKNKAIEDPEWSEKRKNRFNKQQKEKYNNDDDFRREKLKQKSEYKKSEQGAEVRRKNQRKRYAEDPMYRLNNNTKTAVTFMLNSQGESKKYRATFGDILPYSQEEMMDSLALLFIDGMTRGNHGEWATDHIIPKSKFLFSVSEDEAFQMCWTLGNLQPMWAADNISKSNKNFGQWLEENPDMMKRYGENYKKFLQFLDENPEYKPYYYD